MCCRVPCDHVMPMLRCGGVFCKLCLANIRRLDSNARFDAAGGALIDNQSMSSINTHADSPRQASTTRCARRAFPSPCTRRALVSCAASARPSSS